jgi:hypothetical protein
MQIISPVFIFAALICALSTSSSPFSVCSVSAEPVDPHHFRQGQLAEVIREANEQHLHLQNEQQQPIQPFEEDNLVEKQTDKEQVLVLDSRSVKGPFSSPSESLISESEGSSSKLAGADGLKSPSFAALLGDSGLVNGRMYFLSKHFAMHQPHITLASPEISPLKPCHDDNNSIRHSQCNTHRR